MKDNSWLYGEDVSPPDIPQEIVDARLVLLKKHLEKLLDHSYHTRDNLRVNGIIKAIDFWESINKKEV